MDSILLFIKDLLLNKEVAPMFIAVFIALVALFKDIKSVAKVLRTILLAYIILLFKN